MKFLLLSTVIVSSLFIHCNEVGESLCGSESFAQHKSHFLLSVAEIREANFNYSESCLVRNSEIISIQLRNIGKCTTSKMKSTIYLLEEVSVDRISIRPSGEVRYLLYVESNMLKSKSCTIIFLPEDFQAEIPDYFRSIENNWYSVLDEESTF
jgi:hypothetical protein